MTAVLLALAAAASFGAMTVAIRVALSRGSATASRAAAATLVTSFTVTLLASLVRHDYTDAWKFFLAGILAPGLSQILFTRAVKPTSVPRGRPSPSERRRCSRSRSRSRCSDEPVEAQLVVGAVAIVAGGTILVAERDRPVHLRSFGILCALGAAVLFAIRDNIVRALHAHGSPETVAAATMLAGMLVGDRLGTRTPVAARGPIARARPACCSASPTSACSRRTSTAASRSSRR